MEPLLDYFKYEHLPKHLQEFSKGFCVLAKDMCQVLPRTAERSACLRKLLEAKDCAVRAGLSRG